MAGLNDDVMDDLDPDFDPTKELGDNLVVPPQDTNTNETISIVTPTEVPVNTEVSDQDLFDNPVPGELPDLKATITLIKNDSNKILDLKDIEAVILSQECISLESANMVEDYFGNFYSRELAKNSFTHYPTQTNYRYAVKFMHDRISIEEAKIDSNIKSCLKQAKTTILAKCKLLRDKDLVEAQSYIRSFNVNYEQKLIDIINSKDLVIPVGSQFINLLNEPINKLALANADWTRAKINPNGFIDAIAALQIHLANPVLIKFFYWIITANGDTTKLGYLYYDINDCEQLSTNITFASLLDSFIHNSYNNGLEVFSLKLTAIEDTINNIANDPDIINKFNEFANTTEKAIDELSFINDVATRLAFVNNAVKAIVDSLIQ
jgi:hypothetical protein